MYINPNVTPEVAARQRIERMIVRKVVKDALAAGYALDVDDGGDEYAVKGAVTSKAAMDALLNTDEDRLIFHRLNRASGLLETGWVRFVYGNDGWDVISDYSAVDHIETALAGAIAMAERLEERS